jgi:uncharacterized membrane protein
MQPVKRQSKLKIITKLIYIVGALELCILACFALQTNTTIRNTITLATNAQTEPFTELYFQNHTQLPQNILPNRQYTFTFTIHNHENQDKQYSYDVYIDDNNTKHYLDHNTITLKNNATITIQESFLLTQPIAKAKVIINLTDKNQQIDFLIKGGTN